MSLNRIWADPFARAKGLRQTIWRDCAGPVVAAFALALSTVGGASAESIGAALSLRVEHANIETAIEQIDPEPAALVYPEAPDLAIEIRAYPTVPDVSLPIPTPRSRPIWEHVTGLPSPAQRLGLSARARAHAERCLAQAVYFEARGETVRGQEAIAQVILNRVFSRFYPDDVCGVIYQNAQRRHRCQFSFACNGRRKVIKDEGAWAVAERIATLALDGRIWEPEIGKATHYHAVWAHPSWTGEMRELARDGVHIFYRPEKWGDGSNEPNWSTLARALVAAAN